MSDLPRPDAAAGTCSNEQCVRLGDELLQVRAELKRSSEDYARLRDQLLHPQRMEAVGTLAAGLAHDMNNVLCSIMSMAELLLDDRHAPQVRADLENIVVQAERGAGLTRGLLAFSRKGQYRRKVQRIDQVVRDVLPLLAHTLPKGIEVQAALGAGDARVDGDPIQLAQVIVNFSLNAADAMMGKGKLVIESEVVELDAAAAELLAVAPGRHAKIVVTDTGCGMDEATRQRVFEPFFTTKPVGKGTGLGLSLVWGVVKGHHGAVTVRSQPGKGTTFSLYFPLTDLAVDRTTTTSTASAASSLATILVVDDEPTLRVATTRILERLGHTVLGASDGVEALRVFAAHRESIGLVILDMAMPEMGGAECFRRLRTDSSVPVLVATGYAIDEEVQTLVAHGAALIEKPFLSASLVVEVTRLLAQVTSSERQPLRR